MTVTYKLNSPSKQPITLKQPNRHGQVESNVIPKLRCPHCMHMGAFTSVLVRDLSVTTINTVSGTNYDRGTSVVGLRACPNPDCLGIVLVVIDQKQGTVVALPNEVLDFDATDIPAAIASSLEEAIQCHSAQCYKAAALMVRRVLEELCEERGAKGGNLKDRLVALSKLVVIPNDLIEAADHLRLLGNDAAHIEAKTYEAIGEPEVRIAIDLTKELLKGAYQYKGLLGRLTALQKPA